MHDVAGCFELSSGRRRCTIWLSRIFSASLRVFRRTFWSTCEGRIVRWSIVGPEFVGVLRAPSFCECENWGASCTGVSHLRSRCFSAM